MSKELEQKQIEEMAKITKEHCELDNQCGSCHWSTCNECLSEVLYNAGYRKQSENTVELPCRIGDTVYRLKKRRGVWCILPREVVSITYRLDHLYRVVWEIFSTETDTLGISVFLTEAEAEEALAKMKGGAE